MLVLGAYFDDADDDDDVRDGDDDEDGDEMRGWETDAESLSSTSISLIASSLSASDSWIDFRLIGNGSLGHRKEGVSSRPARSRSISRFSIGFTFAWRIFRGTVLDVDGETLGTMFVGWLWHLSVWVDWHFTRFGIDVPLTFATNSLHSLRTSDSSNEGLSDLIAFRISCGSLSFSFELLVLLLEWVLELDGLSATFSGAGLLLLLAVDDFSLWFSWFVFCFLLAEPFDLACVRFDTFDDELLLSYPTMFSLFVCVSRPSSVSNFRLLLSTVVAVGWLLVAVFVCATDLVPLARSLTESLCAFTFSTVVFVWLLVAFVVGSVDLAPVARCLTESHCEFTLSMVDVVRLLDVFVVSGVDLVPLVRSLTESLSAFKLSTVVVVRLLGAFAVSAAGLVSLVRFLTEPFSFGRPGGVASFDGSQTDFKNGIWSFSARTPFLGTFLSFPFNATNFDGSFGGTVFDRLFDDFSRWFSMRFVALTSAFPLSASLCGFGCSAFDFVMARDRCCSIIASCTERKSSVGVSESASSSDWRRLVETWWCGVAPTIPDEVAVDVLLFTFWVSDEPFVVHLLYRLAFGSFGIGETILGASTGSDGILFGNVRMVSESDVDCCDKNISPFGSNSRLMSPYFFSSSTSLSASSSLLLLLLLLALLLSSSESDPISITSPIMDWGIGAGCAGCAGGANCFFMLIINSYANFRNFGYSGWSLWTRN